MTLLPKRHRPAHGVFREPDKPLIVFLTVCTRNRQPWLATPTVHEALRQVWTDAAAWIVGAYVLMPDHLHLFATPGANPVPLDNWVRYWKAQFTRRYPDLSQGWQSDHWDRRLRSEESYAEKRQYVYDNPVRKGLAAKAEDWPFHGELNELIW